MKYDGVLLSPKFMTGLSRLECPFARDGRAWVDICVLELSRIVLTHKDIRPEELFWFGHFVNHVLRATAGWDDLPGVMQGLFQKEVGDVLRARYYLGLHPDWARERRGNRCSSRRRDVLRSFRV